MPLKVLGELCIGLELMQTYLGGFFYVTGAALLYFLWKVQIHVVWENNRVWFRGRGKGKVAGLQGSEIKPIAGSERRKQRRGKRRVWWRELQKSALIHSRQASQVWGRKGRLSIFQSHSCHDPTLHPGYLGCAWGMCVMVSSSLPGDMILCFTARSAVTTTSTTRAVTCCR